MFLGAESGLDFQVFGAAGTTIAILLYGIKLLWAEVKTLRAELSEVQTHSLEKLTTVATTSTIQMTESVKAIEAATIMMHQISGRPGISAEQLYELNAHLRALRERGHS